MRSLILLSALLLASGASAQSDWRPLPDGGVFSVDVLASSAAAELYSGSEGTEVFELKQSYALSLVTLRQPVSSRLTAIISVPLARFKVSGDGLAETFGIDTSPSYSVGNPYLGAAFSLPPEASGEVGVWLPLSTDDSFLDNREVYNFAAANAGTVLDAEHLEAYAKDAVSARVLLSGAADVTPGVRIRGHVAPVLAYYSGAEAPGNEQPRWNTAVTSGAFVDGQLGAVVLTAGASGRYEPYGGAYSFLDDVTVNAFGAVSLEGLPVRPGLQVRVPVSGYDIIDAIVGFSLDVPLY